MSDFLISLDGKYRGGSLLEFIKAPYGKSPPDGRFFDFLWGSVAILEEQLARNNNIHTQNGSVFAWIGDLVMDTSAEMIEQFIKCIIDMDYCESNVPIRLESDELFKKLNGAFAILLAHKSGFSIITDPMNFTPVYAGTDTNNNIVSVGTHPDLVACTSSESLNVDNVSAAEYVASGNNTFPNTIHTHVKEMNPARLHSVTFINGRVRFEEHIYWLPPKKIQNNYKEDELVDELKNALISAVRDRCVCKKVGILLSGGLDSRFIMAAIPDQVDCIGLTFSEEVNRETKTAQKVAKCYKRNWSLLLRDNDFLSNSIEGIARLMGCECEWMNAHAFGFLNKIMDYEVDCLLNGELFDGCLKGGQAFDFIRSPRLGGILPPKYKTVRFDYLKKENIRESNPDFCEKHFKRNIVNNIYQRRRVFYNSHNDLIQNSIEFLMIYPFSHFIDAASWIAERRILPVKLVAMDRRLLDFSCRCPIELKLNNRIFIKAAMEIYGPGARIRNANDGVRPGSSHLSRLAQRAIRKTHERTIKTLEMIGKPPKIQHSWSNYEKYWKESKKLKSLIEVHGENLDQFNGRLFKECGRDLLKSEDINWRNGFRLLHLAVWAGIIKDYQKHLGKRG